MLALNPSIASLKLLGLEMQHDGAAWLPLSPPQHGGSSTPHSNSSESQSKSTTPELKFVTLTGPPSSRSKESRLVVRSHAMQAFLREKKNDGKLAPNKEPDSQVKKLDDALGRFKLASWSRKSTKKGPAVAKGKKSSDGSSDNTDIQIEAFEGSALSLPPQAFSGHYDPFGILPITMTSRTHSMMYHYTTSFNMNSVALNPEGNWLPFAVTDAALLHALLALVAYHFDLTRAHLESPDSLHQKGDAIREMKARLKDSKRQMNDTTIATVSILANLESMNGTRNNAEVHMDALKKMVDIRGGLDKFAYNKVLQRVLAWSDIVYASTWQCKPRFPLLQSCINNDPIGRLDRFPSNFNPSFFQYDTRGLFLSNLDMCKVFEMLRRISMAITDLLTSPAERLAISKQIYLLDHDLLSSPKSLAIHNLSNIRIEVQQYDDSEFETDLSEPFRIAALLYIHIIIRELPSTARMHHKLVTNLRLNLEEHLIAFLPWTSQQTLEILLWICFVGITAASDPIERHYFITLMKQICRGLNISSQIALSDLLRGVIWRDGVCEGYFAGIWEEMSIPYAY